MWDVSMLNFWKIEWALRTFGDRKRKKGVWNIHRIVCVCVCVYNSSFNVRCAMIWIDNTRLNFYLQLDDVYLSSNLCLFLSFSGWRKTLLKPIDSRIKSHLYIYFPCIHKMDMANGIRIARPVIQREEYLYTHYTHSAIFSFCRSAEHQRLL